MIKVVLNGCNGRMGKFVTETINERDDIKIVAGVDVYNEQLSDFPVLRSIDKIGMDVDVVIDFSNPIAFNDVLDYCVSNKTALVECTTGLTASQIEDMKKAAEIIPVFFSANMSLGVNLLIELSKTAAKVLGNSFDIEIVEAHHNQKIDAPSGTALMIADAINEEVSDKYDYQYNRHSKREKRPKNEIGIHSIRGGTIVGEHEVIFAGNNETIKLSHSASSRSLFATGAVNAAIYIASQKPGFYSMHDMISA